MEPAGIFEVILRFAGAISLTISASWLWCLIRQKRMMGGWVWPYFAAVITAFAAWRWALVALIYDEFWPAIWLAAFTSLIQPVNAALFFLLGLSVIILTYAHLVGIEAAKARRAKRLTDAGPYDEVHRG